MGSEMCIRDRISLDANRVLDELVVGEHPSYIDVTENEEFALVSCMYSGEVVKLRIGNGVLREAGRVRVGFEPVGLAIADDTDVFYVGCTANGTVAEVSLETMNVTRVFEVGNWPRYLTLSRDGARLAVGLSGDSRIAVIDTGTCLLYTSPSPRDLSTSRMPSSA